MNKATYLQKSIKLYNIYGYGFLLLIISIIIIKPLLPVDSIIADFLITIPILLVFFLAPLGLYYCLKSYWLKETSSMTVLRFSLGHLFFTILVLVFVVVIIKDILEVVG